MLFSIALAEANKLHSQETKDFWREARTKISRFSNLLISALDDVMEEDDAPEDGLVRMSGDTKARCCARISEQIEVDMFEVRENNRGGSTVPKSWLVSVADAIGVDVEGASKQETVRCILRENGMPIYEDEYFSTGSSVQLAALQAIEEVIS